MRSFFADMLWSLTKCSQDMLLPLPFGVELTLEARLSESFWLQGQRFEPGGL